MAIDADAASTPAQAPALDALQVFLHGAPIGRLDHVGNARMRFTYEDPAGPAISMSMPARAEPYGDDACAAYFGGVLPEGIVRDLIERQERVGRRNDFAMLKLLGGDVAGALTLHPLDDVPEAVRHRWHAIAANWKSAGELEQLVSELPRRPVPRVDGAPLRLTLAGAQDKVAVVVDGDRIGLPIAATPSTHLLKLNDPAYPGLVEVEEWCLQLTRAIGMSAASASVRIVGDLPVLLVERFDRVRNTGADLVSRIHQEDACQALGISSHTKYQAEGGPSLQAIVDLVSANVRPPGRAVLEMLDRAGLHELIGNADAHGKDWSFLLDPAPTPSPMYDVICTLAWPELDERFAMSVGGERRASRITIAHWESEAEALSLSGRLARRRLLEQAQRLRDVIVESRAAWTPTTDDGEAAVDRAVAIICGRCEARLRD